jgi:Tol biopolymer transport system component
LPFVDKLPPGEKIIYTETDETLRSTLVQISNVENLEVRRKITTIPHLFGYKPIGLVSPDGTRIAFLVKPDLAKSPRDSSASGDSQLWVVEISDGTTRILADNVSFVVGWVTSKEIAFARMSFPVSPAS